MTTLPTGWAVNGGEISGQRGGARAGHGGRWQEKGPRSGPFAFTPLNAASARGQVNGLVGCG